MKKYALTLLILALAVGCLLALASCGEEPNPPAPACEHTWNDGIVTVPASCTTDGVKSFVCTKCAETKTESIPAGHVWDAEFTVDKEATCAEAGSKSIHCANCSQTKDATVIEALPHTWAADFTEDKAATCTADGSKSIHCEKCDATKDVTVLPAAHEWATVFTTDKTATCTEDGSKSIHCAKCDEKKDVTAIPAAHVWDADFTVDLLSTCTVDGSKSIHCQKCDEKKDVTAIPAGHIWQSGFTVDVPATCAVEGSQSIHCMNCTETKNVTPIPTLSHLYVSVDTATFFADGFKGDYCINCGDFKNKVASPKTAVTTVAAGPSGKVEGEYNGNYAAHVLGYVDNGIFETNKMYPTETQAEGKDIFFEFSFLMKEGLDAGGEKEIRFLQLCPIDNYGKSVALHWFTLAPEMTGDSAPYAGTMITEKVMHEEALEGNVGTLGMYARKSTDRADFLDLGGNGWHRIGIRLHEDAAIVDGEVKYTMIYTIYIDGVLGVKTTLGVYDKDMVNRNIIPYKAEIVEGKLVYSDTPQAGLSPWRFDKLFNDATPADASISYADMYLSCGDGFIQPVEKLETPVDVNGTLVYFAAKQ